MADINQITGYAFWRKDKLLKIEAEGEENDLMQFINSLKDFTKNMEAVQINSSKGSLTGFREFSIDNN